MLNRRLSEIVPSKSLLLDCQPAQLDLIRNFPNIPVLPETLLQMELKAQECLVDLDEVSQIVLSDPGAALQIMRLAGREGNPNGSLPKRIEDCISGLGLHACLEAISRRTVIRSTGHSTIPGIWAHSRDVAALCGFFAEEAENTCPQSAYLVGLFHELGALPAALSWDTAVLDSDEENLVGLKLAEAWSLPLCVREYFTERQLRNQSGKWTEIVEQAHQLADGPAAHYQREDYLAPEPRADIAVQAF